MNIFTQMWNNLVEQPLFTKHIFIAQKTFKIFLNFFEKSIDNLSLVDYNNSHAADDVVTQL